MPSQPTPKPNPFFPTALDPPPPPSAATIERYRKRGWRPVKK